MEKICALSGQKFSVTEADRLFYDSLGVPVPTLCPAERRRRRLSWRNESHLYWRTCDGTGERILSVFSPDKPYKVYNYDYWISAAWDPMEYGRDFDFNRPFFEQFGELFQAVPQVARSAFNNVDSPYVNQAGQNKRAYMIFEADYTEDCAYCWHVTDSQHCLDCDYIEKCQTCYGCVSCVNCLRSQFLQNCMNCQDSLFLKNCLDCRDCFGSINLRGKQFYFKNQPLSEAEYRAKIVNLDLSSASSRQRLQADLEQWFETQPHPHINGANIEDSTGDYLYNCKNCAECYFLVDSQDAKFVTESRNVHETYDMDTFGSRREVRHCYEVMEVGGNLEEVCFSEQVWHNCSRVYYSKCCINHCYDLFGCVGLRDKKQVILNKAYNTQEYEALRKKIMAHMKETGEWGQYFPPTLSPFGYNETVAQEYLPLVKSEALKLGFKWAEVPIEETYQGPRHTAPDSIKDTDLTICDQILNCGATGKNYRILQSEYSFYKANNLPIPNLCPLERHRLRDDLRNRQHLYDRHCDTCHKALKSTYGSGYSETVLCADCYEVILQS